ncbi:hypothetical protein BS47DRAFT_1365543 [Hydnum rufescens UP504]|uniref:Uncharacterized protein n=1 Tax=Hydnum rufescens UP504 TaxID=1448309 RepID=A0A9P6ANG3_9AGAM|nr:hypothetical protein BS47DRAFT_1365543 [Hydnum rufescens UP504]
MDVKNWGDLVRELKILQAHSDKTVKDIEDQLADRDKKIYDLRQRLLRNNTALDDQHKVLEKYATLEDEFERLSTPSKLHNHIALQVVVALESMDGERYLTGSTDCPDNCVGSQSLRNSHYMQLNRPRAEDCETEVQEEPAKGEGIRDGISERETQVKDLQLRVSELESNRAELHNRFEVVLVHLKKGGEYTDAEIETANHEVERWSAWVWGLEEELDALLTDSNTALGK